MDFEKLSTLQQETPDELKARLAKEGKKVLTAEEYLEELKKKQSGGISNESEEDPYEGAFIAGRERLESERKAKEVEKDGFVKVGGFEEPDRLRIKKFEEMTPREKEEYRREMDINSRPPVRI